MALKVSKAIRLFTSAAIGLAAACCGPFAIGAPAQAKAALAIAPLSRQEINHSITAGLGCDFGVDGHPFLLVVEGEALLKPDGHLLHLTLDNDQSLAIINYGGAFGNGDVRILVDRDAKPFAQGEESQNYRARLTVRSAGRERTVTGVWTCGA